MNTIIRYMIVDNSFKKIAVRPSVLSQKLEKLGVKGDVIIEISAKVPFDCEDTEIEAVIAEIESKLVHWVRNGFEYNGNRYFRIGTGSRKESSFWLREDLLPIVNKEES